MLLFPFWNSMLKQLRKSKCSATCTWNCNTSFFTVRYLLSKYKIFEKVNYPFESFFYIRLLFVYHYFFFFDVSYFNSQVIHSPGLNPGLQTSWWAEPRPWRHCQFCWFFNTKPWDCFHSKGFLIRPRFGVADRK